MLPTSFTPVNQHISGNRGSSVNIVTKAWAGRLEFNSSHSTLKSVCLNKHHVIKT